MGCVFFMGKIRTTEKDALPQELQFQLFDDEKMRLTVVALADRYDERIRKLIIKTYEDPKLHSIYRDLRKLNGLGGGKSRVHREIIRYPNVYVADFVDTVMRGLYGPEWMESNKALSHELVRPWHVVNKL